MKSAEFFQLIYTIGQICDIWGAYLLFKYGIAPNIQKVPQKVMLSEAGYNLAVAQNKEYEKQSKRGFRLIIIGFLLQFVQSLFNLYILHFG